MTVEQRIIPKSVADAFNADQIKILKPGESAQTELTAMESGHPHATFPATFIVTCAEDDSHGFLVYDHPEAGTMPKRIEGDSNPYYLLAAPDGTIGRVDWKHVPGDQQLAQ